MKNAVISDKWRVAIKGALFLLALVTLIPLRGVAQTPSGADQVLTATYDKTTQALRVEGLGSGGSTVMQVNSTTMGTQSPINFENSTGTTVANPSAGIITVSLNPASASVIGGVESITCAAHLWLDQISTSGVPSCLQPSFADISGAAVIGQLPATVAQFAGAITAGDCAKWASSGVVEDSGGVCGSGAGISAVNGTTNQITTSTSSGVVTVSLPSSITLSGTITAASFVSSGAGSAYTQWTTGSLSPGASGTVLCGANAGNVLACSDNAGALANVAFAGNDLGIDSGNTMNVVGLHLTTPGNLGSQPLTLQFNNDTSTGTVQYLLAKQGGVGAAPSAIKIATTDTDIAVYPVISATATSGAAILAVAGEAACTFDDATTYADYVIASTTTAGDCHDDGAALPTGSVYVVGTVAQAGGAAGNYLVKGPGFFAASGSSTAFQANGSALTSSSTVNFESGSGIAVSNPSAGNVSIAAATGTVFFSGARSGSGQALIAANDVQLSGFYLPYPLTFSHIDFAVDTADSNGADLYDIAIYSHAGALEADIGPTAFTTAASEDVATKQGAVTLAPGQYYVAFTGATTTAAIDISQCGTFRATSTGSITTSSGGQAPSSITPPADAFGVWNTCYTFALH